jgi:hypothetical protein
MNTTGRVPMKGSCLSKKLFLGNWNYGLSLE